MDRTRLYDEQWLQILAVLQIHTQVRIGCPDKCREFIESVLWVLRTGAQWRQLPKERGFWNSVFKRYSRDSSVIRAHACAAGASGSSADNEALGRSKGGFSCKVHALTDALGLPVKFMLTGGQTADITQAIPLVEGVSALSLLADKGYDADEFIAWLVSNGIEVVIPPKANRKEQRYCNWWLYKERHSVECMFGKLKHYRRIGTRFEKKAVNYMGMLALAALMLWLR